MHKSFLEKTPHEDIEDLFKSLMLSPQLWAAIQKIYYDDLYGVKTSPNINTLNRRDNHGTI
jgi:hypothetical protein